MAELTDKRFIKETKLRPKFQVIRENLKKLDGLDRYMTFPFERTDLGVSFFDNFCWGKAVREDYEDMEFSLMIRGLPNKRQEKRRKYDKWGHIYDENVTVPDYGLLVYGHSVYKGEQTYMEIVYKGTKSTLETYYQQSPEGLWILQQAVNKRGEVFSAEELRSYQVSESGKECVLPGNDQIIELTKDRLSIGYVSHKE